MCYLAQTPLSVVLFPAALLLVKKAPMLLIARLSSSSWVTGGVYLRAFLIPCSRGRGQPGTKVLEKLWGSCQLPLYPSPRPLHLLTQQCYPQHKFRISRNSNFHQRPVSSGQVCLLILSRLCIIYNIFPSGSPGYIASTTSYYWTSSEEHPAMVILPGIAEDVASLVCRKSLMNIMRTPNHLQ